MRFFDIDLFNFLYNLNMNIMHLIIILLYKKEIPNYINIFILESFDQQIINILTMHNLRVLIK